MIELQGVTKKIIASLHRHILIFARWMILLIWPNFRLRRKNSKIFIGHFAIPFQFSIAKLSSQLCLDIFHSRLSPRVMWMHKNRDFCNLGISIWFMNNNKELRNIWGRNGITIVWDFGHPSKQTKKKEKAKKSVENF